MNFVQSQNSLWILKLPSTRGGIGSWQLFNFNYFYFYLVDIYRDHIANILFKWGTSWAVIFFFTRIGRTTCWLIIYSWFIINFIYFKSYYNQLDLIRDELHYFLGWSTSWYGILNLINFFFFFSENYFHIVTRASCTIFLFETQAKNFIRILNCDCACLFDNRVAVKFFILQFRHSLWFL